MSANNVRGVPENFVYVLFVVDILVLVGLCLTVAIVSVVINCGIALPVAGQRMEQSETSRLSEGQATCHITGDLAPLVVITSDRLPYQTNKIC